MDVTILLFLVQDGIINGAVYALAALALVLVFTVTRVILVPQGEFIAFSALTLAAFQHGQAPPTIWLLPALGALSMCATIARQRRQLTLRTVSRTAFMDLAVPIAIAAVAAFAAPMKLGSAAEIALTLALVIPMGPMVYKIAFEPLAQASVLVLLIASFGVHFSLMGLGLVFFGPEGVGTEPLLTQSFPVGDLVITGQSVVVLVSTVIFLVLFALFFGRTLLGKALRACASNRLGARLVGIPTSLAGQTAFALAAGLGALSGVLVGPLMTVYYDSGFLIGLKAFVAAIIGGLVSYPLAVAAAIGVGILEALFSFWASTFKEVLVFAIIIPVLLVRSLQLSNVVEDEE